MQQLLPLVVLVLVVGCVSFTSAAKPVYRGVATNAWSGGCADLEALNHISWYWNYGLTPTSNVVNCSLGHFVEFVPQVWGETDAKSDVASIIPASTTHIIGFNEPNGISGQANLDPGTAASLWQGVVTNLKNAGIYNNIKIGSPSVSPGGTTTPQAWLSSFFAACTGCRFDFVTIHNYDCNQPYFNGDGTMYWVNLMNYTFGLPVWLTEFSCADAGVNVTQEEQYMKSLLGDLDAAPYVARYSWFTARPTNLPADPVPSLFGTGSTLTSVGTLYNGAGDYLPTSTGGGNGNTGSNTGSNTGNGNTGNTGGGSSSSDAASLSSVFSPLFL